MATKKATPKPPAKRNPDAFEFDLSKHTESQALAKLATTSVLSAAALKQYTGGGDALETCDLVVEMREAGDEAVAGNLSRVERMLMNQAITLDAIFSNLAEQSARQQTFKGIEVFMRLALKARAQTRSTAEALALLKNPMPYIKQANIAHGHQQVNNGQTPTGAGNFQSEPNKLLEADHGERLDIGAQAAAGRTNQALEAVGAVHRASDT